MQTIGILGTMPREEERRLSYELLARSDDLIAHTFLPFVTFNPARSRKNLKRMKEILNKMV